MTKRPETALEDSSDFDSFVPERVVLEEFDITSMTAHRWDKDDELRRLGWPPPMYIRGRKYRSRKLLQEFKQRYLKQAIANRGRLPEKYEQAVAAREAKRKVRADAKTSAKRAA